MTKNVHKNIRECKEKLDDGELQNNYGSQYHRASLSTKYVKPNTRDYKKRSKRDIHLGLTSALDLGKFLLSDGPNPNYDALAQTRNGLILTKNSALNPLSLAQTQNQNNLKIFEASLNKHFLHSLRYFIYFFEHPNILENAHKYTLQGMEDYNLNFTLRENSHKNQLQCYIALNTFIQFNHSECVIVFYQNENDSLQNGVCRYFLPDEPNNSAKNEFDLQLFLNRKKSLIERKDFVVQTSDLIDRVNTSDYSTRDIFNTIYKKLNINNVTQQKYKKNKAQQIFNIVIVFNLKENIIMFSALNKTWGSCFVLYKKFYLLNRENQSIKDIQKDLERINDSANLNQNNQILCAAAFLLSLYLRRNLYN